VSGDVEQTAVVMDGDDVSSTVADRRPLAGIMGLGPGAPLGRYVLEERLGAGGMGVVFAARDPELDRRVAIKVLHARARTKTTEGRARLVLEAQAMAKLSHPGVVAVYDVGEHDGRVFVAMELLDGMTLDRWLEHERPSVDEIVDVLLQAGRGVAQAHAAGLLHRDLKPSNVMVTRDGRAVVMDFGLARAMNTAGASLGPTRSSLVEEQGASLSASATGGLTEAGVIMGTPAYMAPEQHAAKVFDARADQFSFCATGWEALQGKRAFRANSLEALARQKANEGPVTNPERPIPERLAAVLRRGLSADPDRRYPTMARLLDALGRAKRPRARWRWVLGAAGLVGMGAALVLEPGIAGGGSDRCAGAETRVADLWTPERQERIAAAFSATQVPYAEDAWRSTSDMLEDYVQAWRVGHRDACLVEGEDDGLLDLQMACLSRAEVSLAATLDRLERADAATVERAVGQVSSLPVLARCSDPGALHADVAPPSDPEVAAEVASLRAQLERIGAEEKAGHFEAALEPAQTVVARARALSYPPVLAEALLRLGSIQIALGDHGASHGSWSEAALVASGFGADALAADAAIRLVHLTAQEGADEHAALEWARHARASLGRTAIDPLAEARLTSNIGIVHSSFGRFAEAATHFEEAYQAKRALLGDDHPEVAGALENVGIAYSGMGQFEDGLSYAQRAYETFERLLGPHHPDVGHSLGNLGGVYDQMGRHAEALALFRRALEIHETSLGPDHPLVATGLDAIGGALSAMARYSEARAMHERALAIKVALYGETHPEVAWAYGNLGIVADQMGEYDAALRAYDRSLAILVDTFGEGHEMVGATYVHRAMSMVELGRVDEAAAEVERGLAMQLALLGEMHAATASALNTRGFIRYRQEDLAGALADHSAALDILESTLGPEHPEVAATLLDVAAIHGELEQYEAALLNAERSLSILEDNPVSPAFVASAKFLQAQAQWDTGGDRMQARERAEAALALYAEHGESFAEESDEIRTWLAEHGGPGGN